MRPAPADRLSPKVKSAWRITAAIWICVIMIGTFLLSLAILSGAAISPEQKSQAITFSAGLHLAIAIVLLLLFIVFIPGWRYARWRYEVGEWELDIQKGILWRTRAIIPFVRVQNTDTKQGPLQRLMKLSSVTVSTAAGDHIIPGLSVEKAEHLRDIIATQARLAQEDL